MAWITTILELINFRKKERKRFSSYHIETILRTKDGKVKAIFPSMLNQPKRGTKTIVINCWTYSLNWENVEKRVKKIKQ